VTSIQVPAESHPAAPADVARRSAVRRLLFCATLTAGAFAVAWWVPLPKTSLCGMKILTGLPCPGCGMTRSIVHLCHGDLAGACRMHPLGPVLFALLVGTLGGATIAVARGRDPLWDVLCRFGSRIALSLGAGLLLVWVVRSFVVPEWAPDPVGEAALPRVLRW
jgi:hypothetical protein